LVKKNGRKQRSGFLFPQISHNLSGKIMVSLLWAFARENNDLKFYRFMTRILDW